MSYCLFLFTHTATTEIYTLSLHDALPISCLAVSASVQQASSLRTQDVRACRLISRDGLARAAVGGTARQGEKVVHGMAYDQRAVLIGPTRRQARGAAGGWLNALAGAARARPIAGPAVTESVP